MTMACPPVARTLVIAEDPWLAAQISCALAQPGHYLPVVEGPRFLPPEPTAELVRRNNAAARVRPESIFMTGLSDKAFDALTARLASPLKPLIRRISTVEEIDRLSDPTRFKKPPLTWGNDRIGIGLLKAVGKAILDYLEMTRSSTAPMKPVKKETGPRVIGSSALKMDDHNLIVLPRALADEWTPIIINNACASWHR